MKTKDEALDKFKQYIADTATVGKNLRVKSLRTDNGGEYTSNEFKKYCKENKIKREPPYLILLSKMELLKELGEPSLK